MLNFEFCFFDNLTMYNFKYYSLTIFHRQSDFYNILVLIDNLTNIVKIDKLGVFYTYTVSVPYYDYFISFHRSNIGFSITETTKSPKRKYEKYLSSKKYDDLHVKGNIDDKTIKITYQEYRMLRML